MLVRGFLTGLLLALLAALATGKRLKDRMYQPLITHGFCFRRTNGTHQFGCSNSMGGDVGVVHVLFAESDLDWMLEQGPHWPYMAVVRPSLFTGANVERMKRSGKIAGIVVVMNEALANDAPDGYSDDQSCPNQLSSLYWDSQGQCDPDEAPWNPNGSGMLLESFDFPIFLTRHENTTQFLLEDCFNAFNKPHEDGSARDWPLCAVELDAHMYSAVSTETCLRRSNLVNTLNPVKFCDELGDFSYFTFLKAENTSDPSIVEEDQSVIVVSSQLDSITLFDLNEFGADSPITSIVALLETARLLAVNPPDFQGDVSNILFSLLFGEAFDYMASQRLVYDMAENQFPRKYDAEKYPHGQKPLFNVTRINQIVEIGQLFNQKSGQKVFAHTDTEFQGQELLNDLLSAARRHQLDLSAATVSPSKGLPPASSQSILKAQRDIPAMVITDFDDQYTNPYYHSLFDRPKSNLNYDHDQGPDQEVVQHIGRVASTLADYLFEKASSSRARVPTFQANYTLVNELLYCYLVKPACPLFLAVANKETPPFYDPFPIDPFPQYVGVDIKTQFHGIFSHHLLAYFTGEIVEELTNNLEDCQAPDDQDVFSYMFLKGESAPSNWTGEKPCNESVSCGYCFKTLSFRKESKSPAFVIEGYDFKSLNYSSWAESVWKSVNARIFLKGAPSLEAGFFAIGVIVFVFSLVIVFWLNRHASEIFEPGTRTNSTESSATTVSTAGGAAGRPIAL
ncbi:hypothetical protein TCAL_04514 [Tigriopus californicus]|uniref:Nicastrin n=1 Tax=Tigriopus californicus TaxID=6832 RepID=A0A553PB30_TIGCA|nr:nicastrin-like [Tigriopus californicus]TRY74891.1 hypothetical protein TCAL_04514 [Tigriopus californicus]|eukprot:TCALIF_04514-PA protein Name:"Similar to NCSTN Nicastrin (Homo sapiens)" AED:0.02 eAED:0.02 QI:0/-1/0/1/-1/1/1/0/735